MHIENASYEGTNLEGVFLTPRPSFSPAATKSKEANTIAQLTEESEMYQMQLRALQDVSRGFDTRAALNPVEGGRPRRERASASLRVLSP